MLSSETGRFNQAQKNNVKRLYVTDGKILQMFDKAVAVYKYNDVVLDMKNINDEICFISFDMYEGKGNPAKIFYDLIAEMINPPMSYLKEWGDLPKTKSGQLQKMNFEGDFEAFVSFLNSKYSLMVIYGCHGLISFPCFIF